MKRIIPVDLVLFGLTRTSTSNQELLAPLIKNNFGRPAWPSSTAYDPTADHEHRLFDFDLPFHRGPQISQSAEFKALRKPPNSLSRQGSVSLAAFERWEMAVRLITVAFGSNLGRAVVVTFFDLGLCR